MDYNELEVKPFSPKKPVDDLRFARDVMIAYDYLGRDIDVSKASPSAVAIHEWAKNDENRKDFLGMAQKATDLIYKHTESNSPDDQVRAEHKSMGELKAFLAREIEKSQINRDVLAVSSS